MNEGNEGKRRKRVLTHPNILLPKAFLVVIDDNAVVFNQEFQRGRDSIIVGVVVGVLDEFQDEVRLFRVQIFRQPFETASKTSLKRIEGARMC